MKATIKINWVSRIVTLLVGLMLWFLMPDFSQGGDWVCYFDLARYIHGNGFMNLMDSEAAFQPLVWYVLAVFVSIQGNIASVEANFAALKLIPILIGFLPILALYLENQVRMLAKNYHLLLLLNPAYWYGVLVVGSWELVTWAFFICFFILIKRLPFLAILSFCFALGTCSRLIWLSPLMFFVAWQLQPKRRELILYGSLAMLISTAAILPLYFLSDGQWEIKDIQSCVRYFPFLTDNAVNGWQLIFPDTAFKISESKVFFNITMRYWGHLGVLLTVLISVILGVWRKQGFNQRCHLLLLVTLLLWSIHFFSTRGTVLPFTGIMLTLFFYALYSGRWYLYGLSSIVAFFMFDLTYRFLPIAYARWWAWSPSIWAGISFLLGIALLFEINKCMPEQNRNCAKQC